MGNQFFIYCAPPNFGLMDKLSIEAMQFTNTKRTNKHVLYSFKGPFTRLKIHRTEIRRKKCSKNIVLERFFNYYMATKTHIKNHTL